MSKIESIIQKIKVNQNYKKYFFQNASKYQKLHLWLTPLFLEGFFDPSKNLEPIEDQKNKGSFNIPKWEVLDFLEALSIQNKETTKKEITNLLLKIIDNIMLYRKEDGTKIDNFRTDWYMIKILFNLPHDKILIKHINFIEISIKESNFSGILHSDLETIVLPVLIEYKMKKHLLKLLKIIFAYKLLDKKTSYQEREPLLHKHWLNSLLKKYSQNIVEIIDVEGLETLISIVNKVIKEDEGAFNVVWISTIEEHSQNSFPERYDNQLISFMRDLLEILDSKKVKKILDKFLNKRHPIFKRLAFHIINKKYDDCKDLFWNWFDNNKNKINTTFRHEFYKLLNDRNNQFNDESFEKLINWIDNLDYSKYYKEKTQEEINVLLAYKKKEWLCSIMESSKKAKELYEKYNKINSSKIEHPGFDMWTSGSNWIDKEIPLKDKKSCDERSIDDLIDYIKKFDPSKIKKDKFIDDDDLVEGLANDLVNYVKLNPKKYSQEIEKFIDLDWIYKYHLIYGLTNAWKEKMKFNWAKVLDFILNILNKTFFNSEDKYALWLKSQISNLIEEGTKSDDNTFDKSHLSKAKRILFLLIKNKEEDQVEEHNDLTTYVLNSTNGKVLHSLINYSLRYGKLNSSKSIKWESDVRNFFTKQLYEDTEYSKLIFTILGEYLTNLRFLDKNWVDKNFNRIFPLHNEQLWEVSISGYYLYSDTVYTDIYKLFIKYKHIEKALKYKFKSENTNKKIIQHICIMYNASEDMKTILDLIRSKNEESIIEVIRFIWQLERDNISDELRAKIFFLWKEIYYVFKDERSETSKSIFSTLSKWFVFINNMDDKMKYLKLTVKYTEINHNSYFIIKELTRLVKSNPRYVGELYLEMLKNDFYPSYKQEDIINTISALYESGEKENALKITNLYRKKSIYFLNEIGKTT